MIAICFLLFTAKLILLVVVFLRQNTKYLVAFVDFKTFICSFAAVLYFYFADDVSDINRLCSLLNK